MQSELRLKALQEVETGLVQADPDNVFRLARRLADIPDRNLGNPSATCISSRGDYAGHARGLSRGDFESVCHA
jgi:hypothetical protein